MKNLWLYSNKTLCILKFKFQVPQNIIQLLILLCSSFHNAQTVLCSQIYKNPKKKTNNKKKTGDGLDLACSPYLIYL